MKKGPWTRIAFALLAALQLSTAAVYAQVGPALLDPRDGMYLTRIINLTGEQLSIAVTIDNSAPFTSTYPALYSGSFSTSSTPLNNQQNIFSPTPIKLDTLLQHNKSKTYAIPKGNAFWEGMINLAPLIPAGNENSSYATYSGHFSQGQRMTISTVNNPNSVLNNAYIQFGYVYSSTQKILWGKVFDFAASTIDNAAHIAAAVDDGDAQGVISNSASIIKNVIDAFKTNPVTASLNSATTLSQQPVTSQTSEFTQQVTTNYAQVMAYFAGSGGGSCITDASTNNQIYTLASARQTVVTLTDANKQVRYFTAPSYYIYIKNVQAANPGDINEATIVLIDGWIYNLAVGMYQNNANLANLQNLTPLQLMYYAGSTVPPTAAVAATTQPTVAIPANTQNPVTITNVAISYIGG